MQDMQLAENEFPVSEVRITPRSEIDMTHLSLEQLVRQTPFVRGYLAAALWTDEETDELQDLPSGSNLSDFAPEALARAYDDCQQFVLNNLDTLKLVYPLYPAQDNEGGVTADFAGHDFWLTRNHHAVGFWDRVFGENGKLLTGGAHAAGEVALVLGDDKKIYLEGGRAEVSGDVTKPISQG